MQLKRFNAASGNAMMQEKRDEVLEVVDAVSMPQAAML